MLNILNFRYKITEKYQFKNELQRHISANISTTTQHQNGIAQIDS